MIAARIVLLAGMLEAAALATAPAYSLASIVNAATGVSGEFAPNSLVSIYGTDLAYGTEAAGTGAGELPKKLATSSVSFNGTLANLFYVSPTQINFLVPADQLPGPKLIYVIREGLAGPLITIILKDTAPGFFPTTDGAVIATHANGKTISADSPAVPEEVIVLYAAGLGRTNPDVDVGRASTRALPILLINQLAILLGGSVVSPSRVLYAGITPGFAGLYQINLRVPVTTVENPEIRVFIGLQGSPSYLKLPVRLQ